MRVYAAGWALQSPALNFFKQFLALNRETFALTGILYPRRIPAVLEGIPVLDFDEARAALTAQDTVLQCYLPTNPGLAASFNEFFRERGITATRIPDFISALLAADHADRWRLPIDDVRASDIRALAETPLPSLAQGRFLDLASYDTARKLHDLMRASDWSRLLEFDRDDTTDNALAQVVGELHRSAPFSHLRILDTPARFLNALLQLKRHDPDLSPRIELNDAAAQALGPRLAFYQRSLGCIVVPSGSEPAQQDAPVLLSGSIDAISAALRDGVPFKDAIFFMKRSVIDYFRLQRQLGNGDYRVLLRQPDTAPANLIAALLRAPRREI